MIIIAEEGVGIARLNFKQDRRNQRGQQDDRSPPPLVLKLTDL